MGDVRADVVSNVVYHCRYSSRSEHYLDEQETLLLSRSISATTINRNASIVEFALKKAVAESSTQYGLPDLILLLTLALVLVYISLNFSFLHSLAWWEEC